MTERERERVNREEKGSSFVRFVLQRVSFTLLNHFGARERIVFQSFYCRAHAIFISWLLTAITNTHNAQLQSEFPTHTHTHTLVEKLTFLDSTMCDNQWQLCRPASCHSNHLQSRSFHLLLPLSTSFRPAFHSGTLLRSKIICCFWRLRAFRKLVWENYFSTGKTASLPQLFLVSLSFPHPLLVAPNHFRFNWTMRSPWQILL